LKRAVREQSLRDRLGTIVAGARVTSLFTDNGIHRRPKMMTSTVPTTQPFRTILTTAVALLVAPLAAQPRIVDLGVLPGANFSQAWAINERGEIAASSGLAEGVQQHAALWRGGEWMDLGTLPGHTFSLANDINKHGDVVGSSRSTIEDTRGVLWHQGQPIDLGTLPGGAYSTADAINDKAQIAGTATTATGELHLVRWDNGQLDDLGIMPSQGSFVTAINNGGLIVGYADHPDNTRGWLWRDGVFSDLSPLNGSGLSLAYDINSREWIVGYSSTGTGEAHATLWREGVPTDLGALPGAAFSVATGVNDRGQIVGWGYNGAFEPRAILWEEGQVIDLGTLPGGNTSFAMDINDRGVIAGFSNSEEVPTAVHGTIWTDRRRQ
jgi:probable HAF family extracellular repeat protein